MSQRAREAATRVRAAGPEPLTRLGRRAYARVSEATAGLRMEPSFILIGAQRCGTTSLFRALTAHPQLMPPTFHKGVNYFDLNYYRGPQWYRAHFPVAEFARRRAGRHCPPVAFEASGYYLYHPQAMERLGHDLPAVKLVAMLRDPAERAFSAHKHELARGYEREDFERALELEDERLAGEAERIRADPAYQSLAHRHHSYRHRGQYAEQLERLYEFFPRTQVHVIDSAGSTGGCWSSSACGHSSRRSRPPTPAPARRWMTGAGVCSKRTFCPTTNVWRSCSAASRAGSGEALAMHRGSRTINTSCSGVPKSAMLIAEWQVPARQRSREGRSPMERVGPGSTQGTVAP